MSAVPPHFGFCVGKDDAMCYEWTLTSDPSVRLVAYGYEDGIEYAFYRLKNGVYKHLVRIYPVLQDSRYRDTYFWGYAWDIEDIVVASDKSSIMATFKHSIVDDGEAYSPSWQKRIPAVLFTGRTTQPDMKVSVSEFKPSSLGALVSGAGG
jgi:hypothetical protein